MVLKRSGSWLQTKGETETQRFTGAEMCGDYIQDNQDLGARHGLWGFYLAMDDIEGCPIGLGFVCCL